MISISWPISRGFTYLLIVGVEGEIHPFCTIVIFKLSENSDFFFLPIIIFVDSVPEEKNETKAGVL